MPTEQPEYFFVFVKCMINSLQASSQKLFTNKKLAVIEVFYCTAQ